MLSDDFHPVRMERGVILKLFFLAVGIVMLAGCAVQLPHMPELGFNWVSVEGKSQEQLDQDQTACMREVSSLNLRNSLVLAASAGAWAK